MNTNTIPAGFRRISRHDGIFFAHRDEVMHLLHNHEKHERAEHPLNRIMAVEDGAALVTTTSISPAAWAKPCIMPIRAYSITIGRL